MNFLLSDSWLRLTGEKERIKNRPEGVELQSKNSFKQIDRNFSFWGMRVFTVSVI